MTKSQGEQKLTEIRSMFRDGQTSQAHYQLVNRMHAELERQPELARDRPRLRALIADYAALRNGGSVSLVDMTGLATHTYGGDLADILSRTAALVRDLPETEEHTGGFKPYRGSMLKEAAEAMQAAASRP